MKILVGIKQVPDTETKIKIAADGVSIDESGIKWVISPYDEYAIEQALQWRDVAGGEVLLAGAGRQSVQTALRQGLAMGADRAILIKDERYDRADGLARARALAELVRAEAIDLVLLGKYGVGFDEAQTGPMLAEVLSWPHASAVSKATIENGSFHVERAVEGAVEIQEGTLPAVLTCEKGLNEPRLPSLKGIMQSKKKPIDVKTPEELGLSTAELGDGRRLVWETLELPPQRGAGQRIDGDAQQAARELARLLREEAKVI